MRRRYPLFYRTLAHYFVLCICQRRSRPAPFSPYNSILVFVSTLLFVPVPFVRVYFYSGLTCIATPGTKFEVLTTEFALRDGKQGVAAHTSRKCHRASFFFASFYIFLLDAVLLAQYISKE